MPILHFVKDKVADALILTNPIDLDDFYLLCSRPPAHACAPSVVNTHIGHQSITHFLASPIVLAVEPSSTPSSFCAEAFRVDAVFVGILMNLNLGSSIGF